MVMPDCLVCERAGEGATSTLNNYAWAAQLGVGEATVRRHYGHAEKPAPEPKPEKGDWNIGVTYDPYTEIPTDIRTPPVEEAVGNDYEAIIAGMNVRLPDGYELRLAQIFYNQNAWTRDSELQENAVTRPNVRYHFKVVQTNAPLISDEDIAASRKRVQSWKLPRRIPGTGLGAPVAAVINLADMQAHKPEAGGVEALLQRLENGLENAQTYINRQRKSGRNIDEVVLVNNGDPFEGIAGNYANQSHTVQGGLRAQMNTVLDVWESYSRELFPQFNKGQFITVHCNHTQFGRQGGSSKSITGDEDTGSAFLAESLQRILRGRPDFDHVKFTIPHDEMNVYADIAGVPVGFNHGHKIPGNDASGFEKWLNGQVRGDKQAYAARIWITAHRHHAASWDMGSAYVFQCPSCEGEGASKWLRDMTGRYSRSGILAMLIGEHEPMGWSDQAFL
jgi:hypothetical protein